MYRNGSGCLSMYIYSLLNSRYLEECFLNLCLVSSCPLLIAHHKCGVTVRQVQQCLQEIRKGLNNTTLICNSQQCNNGNFTWQFAVSQNSTHHDKSSSKPALFKGQTGVLLVKYSCFCTYFFIVHDISEKDYIWFGIESRDILTPVDQTRSTSWDKGLEHPVQSCTQLRPMMTAQPTKVNQ